MHVGLVLALVAQEFPIGPKLSRASCAYLGLQVSFLMPEVRFPDRGCGGVRSHIGWLCSLLLWQGLRIVACRELPRMSPGATFKRAPLLCLSCLKDFEASLQGWPSTSRSGNELLYGVA